MNMEWTYTCHKFTTEQEFRDLCAQSEWDPEGPPQGLAFDLVGTVYTPGEYDDQGNVIVPPEPLPGYHVNAAWLWYDMPETWAYSVVHPKNQYRVWA